MAAKNRVWLVGVVLAVVSMACSSISALTATAVSGRGEILFQDDFSVVNGVWTTWDQAGSAVTYYEGGLRIWIGQTNYDYWTRPGKRYADARVEVDAARLSGADDNDFGLICRYRNGENFYSFVISSDGYYGIVRVQNGEYNLLTGDTLQFSAEIHQGDGVNRLRADCVGSKLTLWVNGKQVAQAEDTAFQSGEVGLIAGSYDSGGVDIFFDNFIVIKP